MAASGSVICSLRLLAIGPAVPLLRGAAMAATRMILSLAAGVVTTGLLVGAAKDGEIKISASTAPAAATQSTTQAATKPAEKNHVVEKGSLNLEVSADVTLQAVDSHEVKIK